jgi:hypothetical protein
MAVDLRRPSRDIGRTIWSSLIISPVGIKDRVLPGDSAVTDIWFLTPEQYPRSMQVGTVIRVQEGSRLVEHLKVFKVYNKVLEA